jgi:hypothetical protein
MNDQPTDKNAIKVLAIMATPVIIAMLLVLYLPLGLFNAWALQKMYQWFLVPFGAPHVNVWEVWGVYLLISRLIFHSEDDKDNKKIKIWSGVVSGVFATLLMLLIGYFLKGHIHG